MNRARPWIRRCLLVVSVLAMGACMSCAQSTAPLNIMPLPAKVEAGSGSLKIDSNFSISFSGYREARLERAGQRFLHQVRRETGLVLLLANKAAASATFEITTDHESKPIQELGEDESYTLDVAATGAKLHAANPLGTLRGLQTFLQLIASTPDGFSLPALHVEDRPRFPWRGLM